MLTACLYVEFGLGVKQTDATEPESGKDDAGAIGGTDKKIKVFCYDPGFTVSNLGPYNKQEFGARSAEKTVDSVVELVEGKRDAEVGKFIHNSGGYPW